MHGKQWHDHRGHIEGEPGTRRGMGAATEVEGSPETIGMGKTKAGTRGPKRKRLTPVGKGRRGEHSSARAGGGRNVKAGVKAPGRRA